MKDKSIAIMQPYIFPYIGYFQMIHAVDTFIFYDDVNFITRGWINRNRVLINGKDYLFTVPLKKVSQNKMIKDSILNDELYIDWFSKFLISIENSYKKAPNFSHFFPLLESIGNSNKPTISELAILSVEEISKYLGISTNFKKSSVSYTNQGMEKQARLIDICNKENATQYINAIGGRELYKKEDFANEGIKLHFIQSKPIEYKQFKNEFVPWLSIIDVLMFNSVDEVQVLLENYELI